jgi:transposase
MLFRANSPACCAKNHNGWTLRQSSNGKDYARVVDYSGKRIGIADPTTGEIREAEIFVGVLGASNLT